MDEYIEETKLALKWYQMHGIDAYADTDKTSVFIQLDNDIHIFVSGSEVSFRAELYKGL